jgi:hypothetical protein
VHGKTDVNISPETMLDGSLTLLMLGENQKLENTSTCKNLYRYNSQRPLAGVLLDNVKRMVYPSFKKGVACTALCIRWRQYGSFGSAAD